MGKMPRTCPPCIYYATMGASSNVLEALIGA